MYTSKERGKFFISEEIASKIRNLRYTDI